MPVARAALVNLRAAAPALCACVVGIAATLPYLQTIDSYFVADDFGLIHAYWHVPPLHFLSLFGQSWVGNIYGGVQDEIRPVVALSYQFDFYMGAGRPAAFHVSNIAFHALNSVLVYGIARKVVQLSLVASVLAGVIFALFPTQAEVVSWISGRADSIPALFYLAAFFAYATWRQTGRTWLYVASLVAFFLALFSKQYAITMLATLLLYDLVVDRRASSLSWSTLRVYVPFLVLSVGYLGLRYVLFHNFVRENMLVLSAAPKRIMLVMEQQLELLLFRSLAFEDLPSGLRTVARASLGVLAVALGFLPAILEWRRRSVANKPTAARKLAYFGPLWWIVSVAPLTVTYFTPRHLYLAVVGLAITLAIGFDVLQRARRPAWRYAGALASAGLLLSLVIGLQTTVSAWLASGTISAKIAQAIESEAIGAPAGSLLVVGAPPQSSVPELVGSPLATAQIEPPPGRAWLWSWAMPYASQPPFLPQRVTDRTSMVSSFAAYCCTTEQWLADTQETIIAWSLAAESPPAIVLTWDPTTGDLARVSEQDDACLRSHMLYLASLRNAGDAEWWLKVIIDRVRSGARTVSLSGIDSDHQCRAAS